MAKVIKLEKIKLKEGDEEDEVYDPLEGLRKSEETLHNLIESLRHYVPEHDDLTGDAWKDSLTISEYQEQLIELESILDQALSESKYLSSRYNRLLSDLKFDLNK